MVDGQYVEIEASDTHYWIVSVLLVTHSEIGSLIPYVGKVVVAGMDRLEKGRAGSE